MIMGLFKMRCITTVCCLLVSEHALICGDFFSSITDAVVNLHILFEEKIKCQVKH